MPKLHKVLTNNNSSTKSLLSQILLGAVVLVCVILSLLYLSINSFPNTVRNDILAFGELVKAIGFIYFISRSFRFAKTTKLLAWKSLCLASLIWLPGQLAASLWFVSGNNQYTSSPVSDTLALFAFPFVVAGVILLGVHGLQRREKIQLLVHSISFGSGIAFIGILYAAVFVSRNNVAELASNKENFYAFTIDVLLISISVALIIYRRRDPVIVAISLGMIFQSISDVLFIVHDYGHVQLAFDLRRVSLLAALVLWSYGVSHKSGMPTSTVSKRGEQQLAFGAYFMVSLMIVFAFAQVTNVDRIPPMVLYSFLLVFVAILVTQITSYLDNQKLLATQARSIEKISKSEEMYQELATHDSLTNLCNRTVFVDELKKSLEIAQENNQKIAVMFVDLDRFKDINDTYGHGVGDKVISILANRINDVVGDAGLVSRLGGDEFAVLIPPGAQRDGVYELAVCILDATTEPFDINGCESYLSCSIGIAMSDIRNADSTSILRSADSAMYRAKELGRNRIEFMDEVTKVEVEKSSWTLSELHRGMTNSEICVYFQPIYNLETNKVSAYEALARWKHPRLGLVSPQEFIPVAEDNGLIIEIGNKILNDSFQQLSRWTQLSVENKTLKMNINLSFRQLGDPQLLSYIISLCDQYKVNPSAIVFEMTESALLGDVRGAVSTLKEIQAHGFQIHIDDFGTGYSSLSYLKKFPISGFKIDRSYVQGYGRDDNDTAIVKALVGLGTSMNLEVTAEGINSKLIRDGLIGLGCKYGQGFFYSEALPGDQVRFSDSEQADSQAVPS